MTIVYTRRETRQLLEAKARELVYASERGSRAELLGIMASLRALANDIPHEASQEPT